MLVEPGLEVAFHVFIGNLAGHELHQRLVRVGREALQSRSKAQRMQRGLRPFGQVRAFFGSQVCYAGSTFDEQVRAQLANQAGGESLASFELVQARVALQQRLQARCLLVGRHVLDEPRRPDLARRSRRPHRIG
jgi:hypothetical protein